MKLRIYVEVLSAYFSALDSNNVVIAYGLLKELVENTGSL